MSSSDSDDAKPQKRKKTVPVKRGRGRPRKYESESESEQSESEQESEQESEKSDPEQEEEKETTSEVKIEHNRFKLPGLDEKENVFVLVGSCGSGKTHLLEFCMYKYALQRHYKFGVVFSQSKFTGDYRWAPEEYVREYDEDWFLAYWENMKQKVEDGVEKHGDGHKIPRNFVVFDDSLGLLNSSGKFLNFIATHRTSTDIWILTQALTARGSCATVVRLNTTYAFMFPTASLDCKKGLHQNFGGMLPYDRFCRELDDLRKRKYSCLLLRNLADATPENQFCTILAGNVPEFRLKYGKKKEKKGEKESVEDGLLPPDQVPEEEEHHQPASHSERSRPRRQYNRHYDDFHPSDPDDDEDAVWRSSKPHRKY
jgi:hypothetical protein